MEGKMEGARVGWNEGSERAQGEGGREVGSDDVRTPMTLYHCTHWVHYAHDDD